MGKGKKQQRLLKSSPGPARARCFSGGFLGLITLGKDAFATSSPVVASRRVLALQLLCL